MRRKRVRSWRIGAVPRHRNRILRRITGVQSKECVWCINIDTAQPATLGMGAARVLQSGKCMERNVRVAACRMPF